MSAHEHDPGPGSDELTTPARREKKRVGFHAPSGSAELLPDHNSDNHDNDHDDNWPLAPMDPGTPPRSRPGELSPDAPDAGELRLALSRVLTAEREQRASSPPLRRKPSISAPVTPRRARPALRRNTSYDAALEREEADRAEEHASPRQLRSLTDARQRADQLAVSVGSYHSAPGSRRNSDDMAASFQSEAGDSDHYYDFPMPPQAHVAGQPGLTGHHLRQRIFPKEWSRRQSSRIESAAEALVGSHSRRGADLYNPSPPHGSLSGTTTPVTHQAYAEDYVPRPARYRGGILASLLKLYSDDKGGSGSSGQNTPITGPSTPSSSPRPSPPASRPASIHGGSRSRPISSFFGHNNRSNSSLALTQLLKSSSMIAAPGSSGISDHVTEKIHVEGVPKPKRDKHRITVHIAGIISRHRYLIKLCRALMMYGAPTHRLEEYMSMSSRVLEIQGQFLYIPSCMIISFDDASTHTTEMKIVRVPPGIDLGRLQDVHDVYKNVVHDKLGVEEATKMLDDVMVRKPKFSTWLRVPMYGIASACVAPFAFQGRFIDLPFAFLLGCLVGILQLVFAPSNELYAHVFEVTAAIITSFIARGFGSIQNGQLFCFSALAQSSIALILPGYLVLCSSLELQSHNLVAGSVRMVYAMIYTLFLGYGITIGASLYGMLDPDATSSTTCNNPLHRSWYFLFVPGFTMCLCIINQAKWQQTPVMLAMALAGFCVNSYSSQYFDGSSQISNMLGALTVGILANLYSRVGRHVENGWLDFLEWWEYRLKPRFSKKKPHKFDTDPMSDPESRPGSPELPQPRKPRKVGYSLAAAAMLPAIFVQVPSGLAAGGSLLAGITSANQITGKGSANPLDKPSAMGNLDGTAFNVLFSVIQVAIGISVGLFMSALIVYPLGKRRSGLFSF